MGFDWQRLRPESALSSTSPSPPGDSSPLEGVWSPLWGTALITAYLAAAYGLIYEVLPGYLSGEQYLYVAQPLIWSGLAAISLVLWYYLPERPALSWSVAGLAVLAGGFQVAMLVCAGLLFGFGESPYGQTAELITKNGLYIVTLLAGLEASRAYLVHVWGRINTLAAFAAVSVMFALVTVPPAQFDVGGGRDVVMQSAGTTFLPNFADSLVATFFASIGGPLAGFAYMMTLYAFEWFSPYLPSYGWTIEAFMRSVTPLVGLMIVRDVYEAWTKPDEEAVDEDGGLSPIWMVGGLAIVGAIWLQAGMFGVQPAVVSGTSMEPTLSAYDMVFTEQVDVEDLAVGDIIRFDYEGRSVMHRIKGIPERTEAGYYDSADCDPERPSEPIDTAEPIFCTRGDDNNTPDPPVLASQIQGRIVFTIPKGGWLPYKVKELIQSIVP
jgi:signal peptidase I